MTQMKTTVDEIGAFSIFPLMFLVSVLEEWSVKHLLQACYMVNDTELILQQLILSTYYMPGTVLGILVIHRKENGKLDVPGSPLEGGSAVLYPKHLNPTVS